MEINEIGTWWCLGQALSARPGMGVRWPAVGCWATGDPSVTPPPLCDRRRLAERRKPP
jgi:hypothetical protein